MVLSVNFQCPVLPIYQLHSLTLRQSASEEEGYDKATWTSDVETHPPWLRFHLGITRWELYNRKDPNLGQLTHYLATQRILGAGERMRGREGLKGERGEREERKDTRNGGCTVNTVILITLCFTFVFLKYTLGVSTASLLLTGMIVCNEIKKTSDTVLYI